MPAPRLIGETCLHALAVAAVGTAASAAHNLNQRSAARGLQSLKSENVRHKLPPFFCDSPASKSAGGFQKASRSRTSLDGSAQKHEAQQGETCSRSLRREDQVVLPLHREGRNLRTVLPALLVPFFKGVVLQPLDAFHLRKKFVGEGLWWWWCALDQTRSSVSQTKAILARVAFRKILMRASACQQVIARLRGFPMKSIRN